MKSVCCGRKLRNHMVMTILIVGEKYKNSSYSQYLFLIQFLNDLYLDCAIVIVLSNTAVNNEFMRQKLCNKISWPLHLPFLAKVTNIHITLEPEPLGRVKYQLNTTRPPRVGYSLQQNTKSMKDNPVQTWMWSDTNWNGTSETTSTRIILWYQFFSST